ncbi:hypothetical protein DPMN_069765 [Dreissena polymorpha]|uniref:Uncharacterized protein n=1 Tax=Dreissena polymorpha TaxID=45954 RepID=A0A9D3Z457_DREPO|nr:hypothetical protein DPMN_069765 [Dreissena polymorpha]
MFTIGNLSPASLTWTNIGTIRSPHSASSAKVPIGFPKEHVIMVIELGGIQFKRQSHLTLWPPLTPYVDPLEPSFHLNT